VRRLVLAAAAGAVALLGAGGAYVLYVNHEHRDIRGSSSVEFAPVAPATPSRRVRKSPPAADLVAWPTYGFDRARLRFAAGVRIRPPYRRLWTFHGGTLLEFPPALAYGRVYLPTFDGRFYALDARTGRPIWRRATGRCGWASPAVHRHLVVVTFIGHACDSAAPGDDGIVLALDARSGRVRWRRVIGPTESSPLVVRGVVYVGDWRGRVYALSERNGGTLWTFATGGKIKGSAAFATGRIYIGSYDGHVYALSARTGRELWHASGQPRLGGSGTFYSTPAVAYDRVYIGSTDGKVYSFGAQTGKLRWSYGTGGYVYASPAVWRELVLVGSYDHDFYALDAATGELRWRFHANGPISGSASVVDGIVYFSTFADRTYGLDARTGRLLWTFPDGKYSPVVADAKRLYLVGWGRLYGLAPAR
jgi:outer membrane protein assembly factor BamB